MVLFSVCIDTFLFFTFSVRVSFSLGVPDSCVRESLVQFPVEHGEDH